MCIIKKNDEEEEYIYTATPENRSDMLRASCRKDKWKVALELA